MPKYVASNPARVRVELGHFLKCDLKDVLIVGGSVIAAGIIAVFSWKGALIVLGLGLAMGLFSLFEAKRIFAEGDVCPAIVVDAERSLVAAFTDLSKGGPEVPVIRIFKQPLARATGGPFAKNARLAYVAMYNGYPNEPRWRSFGGYLVNLGTTKKKAIQRVLTSIPGEEWEKLEEGLAQIPAPFKPGQYEDIKV